MKVNNYDVKCQIDTGPGVNIITGKYINEEYEMKPSGSNAI